MRKLFVAAALAAMILPGMAAAQEKDVGVSPPSTEISAAIAEYNLTHEDPCVRPTGGIPCYDQEALSLLIKLVTPSVAGNVAEATN